MNLTMDNNTAEVLSLTAIVALLVGLALADALGKRGRRRDD